jgi:hypothetical protein
VAVTATSVRGRAAAPSTPATGGRRRRDERAVAVFGTWMLFGLFLDGWAHQAQKPETFFSPWHGVLYSGFVAAVAWFAWDGWRTRSSDVALDRWTPIGLGLFVTGAVGDGIWHEVFGIEVDLEALLSPTHLLLLIGGFLMVTAPLRAALDDDDEAAPGWGDWWPQAVTLTLTTALVGFFTMYLSAYQGWVGAEDPSIRFADVFQSHGIASVLVTNALVTLPTALVLRRWRAPAGTLLLLHVAFAVGMTGLEGFRQVELAGAAIVAGLAAEAVARTDRLRSRAAGVAVVSLAWWASYFALADATYGIRWTVELWSGTIVLAVASSALLWTLVERSRRVAR